MKPIQIMIDEGLLERLDADEEVRRLGRSEVLRRAAAVYLRSARSRRIQQQYKTAYGKNASLGSEFAGWQDEGEWPGK